MTLLGNHPDINSFKKRAKSTNDSSKTVSGRQKREAVRTAIDWSWFSDFFGAYTFFNSNSIDDVEDQLRDSARTVNTTLKEALKRWSGRHAKGDYIEFIDGIKTPDYRFLAQWSNPVPDLEKIQTENET